MMSFIFEIGASLFDSVLCVYFITKYNNVSLRKNYMALVALILIFGVTILGDYTAESFDLFFTILLFAISLVYSFWISGKHYFNAICSASIYKIALIVLSSSLFHIYSYIFNDFQGLLFGQEGYNRYIYVITHKVLLFSLLKIILVFVKSSNAYEDKKNGLWTFLFSLITVFGLSITISVSETAPSKEVSTKLLWLALIFSVLNVLLYVLLYKIYKLYKKQYELELFREIAKNEEDKYQKSLEMWHSAEKLRHDHKNHIIAISAMLDNGDVDKCRAYIDEYLDKTKKKGRFTKSGNSVLDYMIDSKLSPLDDTEIIVAGDIGNLSDVQDTDLASLIGNILDNAIEAQTRVKERRIELLFNSHNEMRMIICKNTIEDSVLKKNKELHSTKNSAHHGYGNKIVSDIVKKYGGLVQYFEEEGTFGVQVMLPFQVTKN